MKKWTMYHGIDRMNRMKWNYRIFLFSQKNQEQLRSCLILWFSYFDWNFIGNKINSHAFKWNENRQISETHENVEKNQSVDRVKLIYRLILIFDSFLYAAYISSILFYDYCYSRRAVVVIVCCWYLVSYLSNKFLSFSQTNPNRNQLNVLSISSWSHFSMLWFSVGRICSIFHLVLRLKSELRIHMQRHRKCVRIL